MKNIKKEQYPLDIISVKMYNVKAVIRSGTVLMRPISSAGRALDF